METSTERSLRQVSVGDATLQPHLKGRWNISEAPVNDSVVTSVRPFFSQRYWKGNTVNCAESLIALPCSPWPMVIPATRGTPFPVP